MSLPPATPTPLYVKERGGAPAAIPGEHRPLSVAYYDTALPPLTPLKLGLWVEISSVTMVRSRTPMREVPLARKDEEVMGCIVGIRAMERTLTEFIVKNHHPRSTITYAYVVIPHREGETVEFPWCLRLARSIILPFLQETRSVQFIKNAFLEHAPIQQAGEPDGADQWPPQGWRRAYGGPEEKGQPRETSEVNGAEEADVNPGQSHEHEVHWG
ncbi:hypothetical protein C8Q79DRAFT_1006723 [Trametes meyenii]|nr:hypothetical protein C8Q79DRAFT_1006723 [Trametes meyenii]